VAEHMCRRIEAVVVVVTGRNVVSGGPSRVGIDSECCDACKKDCADHASVGARARQVHRNINKLQPRPV
jgi:hypothetical protein